MLKVTYREKTAGKLRQLFSLHAGPVAIPGQIYERAESHDLDRFFWNFAGKFPWDVGDGLPPFRFELQGKDLSALVYFGVPQAMLKLLYDFTPKAAEKYRTDTNRNCANCEFLRYAGELWDEYWGRPTSERFEPPPHSLYSCAVSGIAVDHLPIDTPYRRTRAVLQDSLRENSCGSHTRRAYKVELSPDAREAGGPIDRWVPAEHRRLQALNPESISFNKDRTRLYLPAGIELVIARE